MNEQLTQACAKAAAMITSIPQGKRIRVVSHYDADGISAAAVLCHMLYRSGYDFTATLMRNPFTKGFDRLKQEHNELVIFSDMGSGQLETIAQLGCNAIILDHHQVQTEKSPKNIIQINCNSFGVDGNYEASGATLSYLLARAVDDRNIDLAALALAGATGDKQYIGGMKGVNKEILDQAVQNKVLLEQVGMKLCGETIADALFYCIEPYYPGLSGNHEEIANVLKRLDIDPGQPPENLAPEQRTRLHSYLVFLLIKAGCQQNILDLAIRKRYMAAHGGWELERFADLLDACGKHGHRSLGLSLCLGDASAWDEAFSVEKEYKQIILDELQALEQGGVQENEAFRYFYAKDSSLGGVIAGIAVNYLLDDKKPLISLVRKKEDDEIHVSGRGNQMLVQKGLDLAAAMKTVTADIGGHGGGHKIAAGATIAFDKEAEFLEQVKDIIIQQMKEAS